MTEDFWVKLSSVKGELSIWELRFGIDDADVSEEYWNAKLQLAILRELQNISNKLTRA